MKKLGLLFVGVFLAIVMTGCGTALNNPPVYMGNNRYHVNVSGFAGLTIPSKVAADWYEAASKACHGRPYDIITWSYTGKDQSGMEGVVQCH
jgi:hypothetical protein